MPWMNRYFTAGGFWHITHRCHNRQFLLRFRRDRDAYRRLLRAKVRGSGIDLYAYCLTSNHVHILLRSIDGERIVRLMKSVAGEFAQAYNRRKQRSGAYWSDRYHATLIDSGEYLWRCLQYIDLNMVRAGQVAHPADWPWCGYHELVGERKRYRLLNMDALRETLDYPSAEAFHERYREGISERLANEAPVREGCWTESLAAGRKEFVEHMAGTLRNRRELEFVEPSEPGAPFVLRERAVRYVTS